MRKLIILFLILSFPAVLLAQNCEKEISRAKLRHLILPSGGNIVKQALSAENKQIIFLAVASQQSIFIGEDAAILYDDLPKLKKSEITIEKAQEILQEWEKMNNQNGFSMDKSGGVSYAKTQEFWIYDIKTKKWLKVDWETGKGLFEEWTSINDKSLIKDRDSCRSPLGDKEFFEKEVGKRRLSEWWFPMGGVVTLHKLAVKCSNGKKEKLFFLLDWRHWPADIHCEWSTDGSFAVVNYDIEKYVVTF